MKKLTKEEVESIKKAFEEGKKLPELVREFNVTKTTIRYHTNEEFRNRLREYNRERYRNMSKKKKKEYLKIRREYQKQYHKRRYHSDEEYRKRQIERAKKYQERTYKKIGDNKKWNNLKICCKDLDLKRRI